MEKFEIVVVGAHMQGLPLNAELTRLGGSFVRRAMTTEDYRFYALAGGPPKRPGLLRIADGMGAAIEAEVWALSAEGLGRFTASVPPPLSIGTVRLSDGSSPKGFLVEPAGLIDANDITCLGGWRAYLAETSKIG